ncbi:Na/Pi cotransporter family protein [Thermobrachium celere]|uniref:PhoU domain-containing protein n=1 Tax=Thermobrachium celere DSM 8682 TaxID=941824 RepID=R7RRZ8_9CLOT|nr:Na/Pi symporter [Thermobrachium celere]CDF58849.1 hypothetical protein TCEL_01068 [Thermobrachium celere DSM 8682]
MRTQTYNLLGGIGLLIFSLSMLSHASQNFFSLWFHKNFNKKEKNRFMSLIQGIIFSFITESSTISATAYSGLLESNSIDFTNILYFISGVNIGASLVPIIVLLKFSIIPYLFVFLGTFLIIFINKSTKKNIYHLGYIILAVGLLLTSIIYIESGIFQSNLLHLINNNYISSLFVGIITALLFRSSNAVVLILIPFTAQNIISLNTAIFIIIGANIGSSLYVTIRSRRQEKHIKVTSIMHFILNVFGAFAIYLIFVLNGSSLNITNNLTLNILSIHFLTNLLGSLVSILFSDFIINNIVNNIFPYKAQYSNKRMKYINPLVINTPSIAIEQCIKEICRMGHLSLNNLYKAFNLYFDYRRNDIGQIEKDEELIDYLEDSLMNFLTTLSMKNPTYRESEVIIALYNMINDMERVGDHAMNLVDLAEYKFNNYINFSEEATVELKYFYELCYTAFLKSLEALEFKDISKVNEVIELENKIDLLEKQLRKDHIDRLNKMICKPNSGMIFLDTLTNLERVGDHAYKIALTTKDIIGVLE